MILYYFILAITTVNAVKFAFFKNTDCTDEVIIDTGFGFANNFDSNKCYNNQPINSYVTANPFGAITTCNDTHIIYNFYVDNICKQVFPGMQAEFFRINNSWSCINFNTLNPNLQDDLFNIFLLPKDASEMVNSVTVYDPTCNINTVLLSIFDLAYGDWSCNYEWDDVLNSLTIAKYGTETFPTCETITFHDRNNNNQEMGINRKVQLYMKDKKLNITIFDNNNTCDGVVHASSIVETNNTISLQDNVCFYAATPFKANLSSSFLLPFPANNDINCFIGTDTNYILSSTAIYKYCYKFFNGTTNIYNGFAKYDFLANVNFNFGENAITPVGYMDIRYSFANMLAAITYSVKMTNYTISLTDIYACNEAYCNTPSNYNPVLPTSGALYSFPTHIVSILCMLISFLFV
jgi:hypothetical protein